MLIKLLEIFSVINNLKKNCKKNLANHRFTTSSSSLLFINFINILNQQFPLFLLHSTIQYQPYNAPIHSIKVHFHLFFIFLLKPKFGFHVKLYSTHIYCPYMHLYCQEKYINFVSKASFNLSLTFHICTKIVHIWTSI